MLFKINEQNKAFLRVFFTYGIHIWVLIFVCNIAIFYSIRFFIKAATIRTTDIKTPVQITESPPEATGYPTLVPTAGGPVVDLSFSLPGIGTNGGNLKPSHAGRGVTIYLFNSDANTSDKTVRPIYTVKTQATYDNDPNSSTYTFFVNKYVDLGPVANGSYQIAIQTPQALRSVIRSPDPNGVGGKLFELPDKRFLVLPPQILITGDIYPLVNGDNFMDINDYNTLVNCYSQTSQTNSLKCADPAPVDLDDNGIVDGIDYNVMLMNFRTLLSLGVQAPTIGVSPVTEISPIVPTKSENIRVSPLITSGQLPAKSASGGAAGTIIIFILLVCALGIIAFAIYKFHLFKILFPKKSAEQTMDQSVDQTDSKIPVTDMIEKTGYLKIVSADAQTNGIWVTIADDTGVARGFYPKTGVNDGFVKIKGFMKNDQEYKPYIYITEINAEE